MNENPNQERAWPEDLDPLADDLTDAFAFAVGKVLSRSRHVNQMHPKMRDELIGRLEDYFKTGPPTVLTLVAAVVQMYDDNTRTRRRRNALVRQLSEAIDVAELDDLAAIEILTTPLVNLVNSRTVVDAEILDSAEPAGEPIDLEATAARSWITEHRSEALQMIRDSEPF